MKESDTYPERDRMAASLVETGNTRVIINTLGVNETEAKILVLLGFNRAWELRGRFDKNKMLIDRAGSSK